MGNQGKILHQRAYLLKEDPKSKISITTKTVLNQNLKLKENVSLSQGRLLQKGVSIKEDQSFWEWKRHW